MRADAVKNRQSGRQRIDQHYVAPDMTVPAAQPFTTQWMIPMSRLQGHTCRNAVHHSTKFSLDRRPLNPFPEITPKLAF